MNTQGILVSTVLRLIIAVICIGILIGFGVQAYNAYRTETLQSQARDTLDEIITQAALLDEGESATLLLTQPAKYSLFTYGGGHVLPGIDQVRDVPGFCQPQVNCMCVCKHDTYVSAANVAQISTRLHYQCEEGYCQVMNEDIVVEGRGILIDITDVTLHKEEGQVLLTRTHA